MMSESSRLGQLEQRWKQLLPYAPQIADQLEKMALDFGGADSRRVRSLSKKIRQGMAFESALQNPDVLAICLPLLCDLESHELNDQYIAGAVRAGYCSLGRDTSAVPRLITLFLYPAIVFAGTFAIAVFFSVYVTPQFEDVFAEFGIELPKLTLFVLGIAKAIRALWWPLFMMLGGLFGFLVLANTIRKPGPGESKSWLDIWLTNSTKAVAGWAWHVSLLLDAGLEQADAVSFAGNASAFGFIRRACKKWHDIQEDQPGNLPTSIFKNKRHQLVETALKIPNPTGKNVLFREIATYYLDRNQNVGEWWLQWFVGIFLWGVGFAIVASVFALFMPMFAVVSGLV